MKLSICIPTFQRAQYLEQLLLSIAEQWCDDLEICISDNASSDDTPNIVEHFRSKLGNVRYFRWDSNKGADVNYLKSVELAQGEYCWLIGSDDTIAPKSIQTILSTLQIYKPNIVLFNRWLCSQQMELLRQDRYLSISPRIVKRYDFSVPGVLEEYLRSVRSMCATFSYLSSMVFKKKSWDEIANYQRFIGTAYVHTFKLLQSCINGSILIYINASLVNCRLGNDSFRDAGLAKRVLLDLDGYIKLASECFGESRPSCRDSLIKVLRHEYPLSRILRYQGVIGSDPNWELILQRFVMDVGYSGMLVRLATFFGRSRSLVNLSFRIRDFLISKGR